MDTFNKMIAIGKAKYNVEEEFLNVYQNRVILMNFPAKDHQFEIADYLNNKYKTQYRIWNVSEHTYPTSPFNN